MHNLGQSEKRDFATTNMHLIVCIPGRLPFLMQIKTSLFLPLCSRQQLTLIGKVKAKILYNHEHKLHVKQSSLNGLSV